MSGVSPSLPSQELLRQQADWLAPARAGLLRRAAVAHCRSVLDLGAGRCLVTSELVRRSSGRVHAFDITYDALHEARECRSAIRIAGDSRLLPYRDRCMDLVFSQFALLWMADPAAVLSEIWRALLPGGRFCAIEPDFPGLIEYPPSMAVAQIWLAALRRSGATGDIGRRLPGLLAEQGFKIQVRLLDQLHPPSSLRFAMLRELPLQPDEVASLDRAEETASKRPEWLQVAHLPLFLINAVKPA